MSKRPITTTDRELLDIERQLRAIDRKQDALKGLGLRPDPWLERQGNALHQQRQARAKAVNQAAAAAAGWAVSA